MSKNNLIIIYTGNGKGKTSAALGLATRALREKMKVLMVQFVKSEKLSGEVSLKAILPKLQIKCFGRGFVISNQQSMISDREKKLAQSGIEFVRQSIKSSKYEVIILDEIWVAYNLKLIKMHAIMDLIKDFRKSGKLCLVLTGRGCPKSWYKYADLVTEMKEIKHPFKKGIQAIKGIDF